MQRVEVVHAFSRLGRKPPRRIPAFSFRDMYTHLGHTGSCARPTCTPLPPGMKGTTTFKAEQCIELRQNNHCMQQYLRG